MEGLLKILGNDERVFQVAQKAYRRIYWDFSELHALAKPSSIREIVSGLCPLVHSDVLLCFIAATDAYLSYATEIAHIRSELRGWVQNCNLSSEIFMQFTQLCQQEHEQSSYLIISLQTSKSYPGKYLIEGWFTNEYIISNSKKDCKPLEPKLLRITSEETNEQAFTLEEVKSIVRDWIDRVKPILNANDLTLEFFISHDLMTENWHDNWQCNLEDSTSIEFEFPVVIRCVERYKNPDGRLKTRFKEKWENIQRNANQFVVFDGKTDDFKRLSAKLRPISNNNIVGLKINCPLEKEHKTIYSISWIYEVQ